MNTECLLNKLNTKFANKDFTKLANEGKLTEAADRAARWGINGIAIAIANAAGLNGEEFVSSVHAAVAAERKAKFARK